LTIKDKDQLYLQRCFDLARLGRGAVSPNPTVGAVLVAEGRIIGEGFHEKYGEAHAEVNTLRSVEPEDRYLIPDSTLYVSLEPCCIYGRTPPCTQLILDHKIPRVVIAALDHTPEVAGQGVAILRDKGVEVRIIKHLEGGKECSLIRNHFVERNRPFIILKFAHSRDGYIGRPGKQLWLSNALSKRLVHKWRAETDAIMVGTETARIDNPQLNNRLFPGKPPLRIVPDRKLSLSPSLHLFDGSLPSWILHDTSSPHIAESKSHLHYVSLDFNNKMLSQLMQKLAAANKSSLLVEGGARLLKSFIDLNLWDEARLIEAPLYLGEGIAAPKVSGKHLNSFSLGNDRITILRNENAS
jgi:diaminohydroxyphosphoribosylaminopyrimidine deaminase/5-amino-6-(5-phosphoribosylamino)uracil reductase